MLRKCLTDALLGDARGDGLGISYSNGSSAGKKAAKIPKSVRTYGDFAEKES